MRLALWASIVSMSPTAAVSSPYDASVILYQQGRELRQSMRGAYVAKQGSKGYVLSGWPIFDFEDDSPANGLTVCDVVFGAGTPNTRRYPATPVGFVTLPFSTRVDKKHALWEISTDDLPPAPKVASKVPTIGAELALYELSIAYRQTRDTIVARNQRTVSLHKTVRDESGKLQQYLVRGEQSQDQWLGIVANKSGEVVGLMMPPSPGPELPGDTRASVASVLPLETLLSDTSPRIQSIKISVVALRGSGAEFRIEARLHDPFGQIKSARILFQNEAGDQVGKSTPLDIPRITSLPPPPAPDRRKATSAKGRWTGPAIMDGDPVPSYRAQLEYVLKDGTKGKSSAVDVEVGPPFRAIAR